jgi:hypothetical protein
VASNSVRQKEKKNMGEVEVRWSSDFVRIFRLLSNLTVDIYLNCLKGSQLHVVGTILWKMKIYSFPSSGQPNHVHLLLLDIANQ